MLDPNKKPQAQSKEPNVLQSGIEIALNLNSSKEPNVLQSSGIEIALNPNSTSRDLQKEIDSLNQKLAQLRTAGARSREVIHLQLIGQYYTQLGEPKKALNSFQQALVLVKALKDPIRQASLLNQIGDVYKSWGRKQEALDSYNEALVIQRTVREPAGEADTLTNIADVYSSLSDYQQSIVTYTQALSLFQKVGKRSGEASTLNDIGDMYRLLGNHQKAFEFVNQSLAVWRSMRSITFYSGEFGPLASIVRIHKSLGNYQEALNYANQIISLAKEHDDRFQQGTGFAMLGGVYQTSANYQKALDSFNSALPLMNDTAMLGLGQLGRAHTLSSIGKTYDLMGNLQQALESYKQALPLYVTLGERSEQAKTLYDIAEVERKLGNLNSALTQIEAAIAILENIRNKVASPELRTSYFALNQDYYQFKVDLLMQLHLQQPGKGYDALALQASESARARSLVELLTEANADIRQGVEPKLLEQERSKQQQLDALEKRRRQLLEGKHTPAQVEVLKQEEAALLAQYQQVQAQIRATSPRYAALTQPQPLALTQMQQLLEPDTLLLEYSLGKERSYLWAVTPNSITSYELPKQEVIEKTARQFYQLLTDKQFAIVKQDLTKVSADLSQMLLGPVATQLGKKRLVIVSDGALQYVPFAALTMTQPSAQTSKANSRSSPVPLLVEHEIINLPSASTLSVIRREHNGRQPAAKTLAVLADPVFGRDDKRLQKTVVSVGQQTPAGPRLATSSSIPLSQRALERSAKTSGIAFGRLPATRQEAEQILALVPTDESKQAWDFAASRSAATSSDLSQYRIVHFATHGILDSVNPELSGIVFSLVDEKGVPQNGFLRLHEIFNLNLPAELIVLSACETGLGKEVRGEGLVGLTRGFMYAGSPRVVVSLWSVRDDATAVLMTQFYKGMLSKGLQPAAALRAAQLEMWKQHRWQSPYYWAPFVLQGEWK